MYYAHFARLRQMDLHMYLNVVFKHFAHLVREFDLLDRKETACLDDLMEAMNINREVAADGDEPVVPLAVPETSGSQPSGTAIMHAQNNYHQLVNASRGNGSPNLRFSSIQSWSAT